VCSQVSYSIILDSVFLFVTCCICARFCGSWNWCAMFVLLVVCAVSCGVFHYLHSVDVGHQFHYALSCIADCSSRGFLSTLGMVRIFPVGCRCVVVYLDTPLHTGTQLEKSSPSPKATKICVNYNQQYNIVHSDTV